MWRNRDVIDLVTVPCYNNARCGIKEGSFARERATGTARGTDGHGSVVRVIAHTEAVCVMQVTTPSVLHGGVSAYDLERYMEAKVRTWTSGQCRSVEG